jgi:hypothetical protein
MTATAPDPEDAISAFAGLVTAYAAIAEIVDGYRANLLTRGYSDSAAEAMTVEFHRNALPIIFAASVERMEAQKAAEQTQGATT